MRIVIDMQGAQSTGSRNRGIGRYSTALAKAIIRNKGAHEVLIVLNGLFADTIEPIRAEFDVFLPQEKIRVWHAPGPVCHLEPANNWRRNAAELTREAFLAGLNPDFVYVSSLFEGLGDDAVTSVGRLSLTIPTAVTLYDLIPFINRKPYLENPVVEAWYENKLDQLRRADLLLAISESSRQEGIAWLGFSHDQSVNVGTAADPQFARMVICDKTKHDVCSRYGLLKPFVMYTGGIDYRKNIEGLIRAFALLPKSLRKAHQLAIVCSVNPHARGLLETLVADVGLDNDDVVLTGFVPEEDLITLYNLCKLFVFPSWHEGFGLPALEAMSCGAPVIAANTSSLPEVVGREDALFDPRDDGAIAEKIIQALTDDAYRSELIQHGLKQAGKFSWDVCAQRAIAAMERVHIEKQKIRSAVFSPFRRPKLAYVSPLPPERSGISDYSAELLPELSRYYDIDVIVVQESISDSWINGNCSVRSADWLLGNARKYERVLYHFGNSHFHAYMCELLVKVPGVVVLHDFYLSGLFAYIAHQKWANGTFGAFEVELYNNHGYKAVIDFCQTRDVSDTVMKYPCSSTTIEAALGVIVHSNNSRLLSAQWYGEHSSTSWAVIPLMRVSSRKYTCSDARNLLNIDENAFVICSFGLLGPTKLNHRLLDAWLASSLSKDKDCMLIFVGENHGGDYGNQLQKAIQNSVAADRIHITGWVGFSQFHQHLAAADVGVQLRTLSRGETSAAVLDCMNYGLPTVVNANGAMADLVVDAVCMLPDDFDNVDLVNALETLHKDKKMRSELGGKGREVILTQHSPRQCADLYAQAIERYYEQAQSGQTGMFNAIRHIDDSLTCENDWLELARSVALNCQQSYIKQILVDITALVKSQDYGEQNQVKTVLLSLLKSVPKGYRVEPVYAASESDVYRYARQFTMQLLSCSVHMLSDDVVEAFSGDVFIGLQPQIGDEQIGFYRQMRNIGGNIFFVVNDSLPILNIELNDKGIANIDEAWRNVLAQADGLICTSQSVVNEMERWLNVLGSERLRPLHVGIIPGYNGSVTTNNASDTSVTSQSLLDFIEENTSVLEWMPDDVHRYWGSDPRLNTQVGVSEGRDIVTTQKAGHLLYGPYLALPSGSYRVSLFGVLEAVSANKTLVDIAIEKGTQILAKSTLVIPDQHDCLLSLVITLEKPCTDLEVRVLVKETDTLRISMIKIEPLHETI